MALIEVKLNLERIASALERIAGALEYHLLPPVDNRPRKPARFIEVDPATIAEAEEEDERRRAVGTMDAEEPEIEVN